MAITASCSVGNCNCVEECVGGRGGAWVYIALLLSSYMYVYIVTRTVTTTALCGIPRCVGAFVGYEADAPPRQTGCMPYHICSGTCLCVMQCCPQ